MHSFVLQDWITILGISAPSPGQIITQGESGWLDLAPYQDISIWLDVREFTPSTGTSHPEMIFETSPIKEDALFQPMAANIVLNSITNPTRVPITTAFTPVARYVRWKLQGPTSLAWDATFRILLSADAAGL